MREARYKDEHLSSAQINRLLRGEKHIHCVAHIKHSQYTLGLKEDIYQCVLGKHRFVLCYRNMYGYVCRGVVDNAKVVRRNGTYTIALTGGVPVYRAVNGIRFVPQTYFAQRAFYRQAGLPIQAPVCPFSGRNCRQCAYYKRGRRDVGNGYKSDDSDKMLYCRAFDDDNISEKCYTEVWKPIHS